MQYYAINEETARRSHEMMSFSDYREGSATAEYRSAVDKAAEIAERQKARVDPMYHGKIDGLLDAYARKLAEVMNRDNEIGTRCPSVMIAGPSNFPVRKKEKQVAAWDRNREEWEKVNGLLEKIKGTGMGGISSDDPNALDKLRAKLEDLEHNQERMSAANKAIRMKDTEKGNAKLAEMGYSADGIRKLREPDFCGRIGFPGYALSNNNANIHRVRERIAQLEKRQSSPPPDGWKFDGGEVVMNMEENRLQILFDEKPDDETRSALKSNGFRWSPKHQAWQRQLTHNAERAARLVLNLPDRQPAAATTAEDSDAPPATVEESPAPAPEITPEATDTGAESDDYPQLSIPGA